MEGGYMGMLGGLAAVGFCMFLLKEELALTSYMVRQLKRTKLLQYLKDLMLGLARLLRV